MPNLLETTVELLDKALQEGIGIKDLYNWSEGEIQYEWLRKFAAGEIPKPGIILIQTLHDLLVRLNKLPKAARLGPPPKWLNPGKLKKRAAG